MIRGAVSSITQETQSKRAIEGEWVGRRPATTHAGKAFLPSEGREPRTQDSNPSARDASQPPASHVLPTPERVRALGGIPVSHREPTPVTHTHPGGLPASKLKSWDTLEDRREASPTPSTAPRTRTATTPRAQVTEPGRPAGVAPTPAEARERPVESVVLKWKSEKPTFAVHWFPMREVRPGGDPAHNLYAPGGILEKYDRIFGRESQDYERRNHARPFGATTGDAGWAGHCNNAAEVACLLEKPRHAVSMRALDGSDVELSVHEIEGLLTMVSDVFTARIDFRGARYDGPSDDPNDPSPLAMLDALEAWSKDKRPFVLDVARGQPVWNYPFDQVEIHVSAYPPAGFSAQHGANPPPRDEKTSFYRFHFAGTGYDEEVRDYHAWIHTPPEGSKTSGWIALSAEDPNPDFLWRPELRPGAWAGASPLNPHVLAEDVERIYRASLV